MNADKNEIRIKKATAVEIAGHLRRCNANFEPPLASRVDIDQYSCKLADKAVTFESYEDGTLIGLVAAYINDESHNEAFITNVSVISGYEGTGLAKELMLLCIHYAEERHYGRIALEVAEKNKRAIRFYQKLGFKSLSIDNGQVKMILSLDDSGNK